MSTEQRNRPISWTKVLIVAVGTICMGIMFLLVLSWPQQIRNGNRSRDQNNLKQIALAIINYADTNRGMPPPAIYSDDGKPLLSWRVLILPYLEEGDLFEQFQRLGSLLLLSADRPGLQVDLLADSDQLAQERLQVWRLDLIFSSRRSRR